MTFHQKLFLTKLLYYHKIMNYIKEAIESLELYISNEDYKGYDPYDTLNSWMPFNWFGNWGQRIAIQFQKRNPINIRPLIGIKKFRSTKGMGLLLSAYLNMYTYSKDQNLLAKIENIKNWLLTNSTSYKNTICWGYDYPYATSGGNLQKNFPTVIHHSYIIRALFEYYKLFGDEEILNLIKNSEQFVIYHLKKNNFEEGICFGYNPIAQGCCYNANMHAAECLARVYYYTKDKKLYELIIKVVDFITSVQKEDGSWYYSFKKYGGTERKQIDFHQGFILESYCEIINLIGEERESWKNAIEKGISFYYNKQFNQSGKSFWRLPRKYPVDIHNQSQGIITFSKLSKYNPAFKSFANTIANWTINNMRNSNKGYFYYRMNKYYINKISYMRWSQSWMFLALSELILLNDQSE